MTTPPLTPEEYADAVAATNDDLLARAEAMRERYLADRQPGESIPQWYGRRGRWQITQPPLQSVHRTPPTYPCTCREPAAPYVTHSTLGPCYVTAPPEPPITADQWLAASCRDCACPGECERLWAENVRQDAPNAYGTCPLCRKALERDEQTIEVLQNGGDSVGLPLCVACAMERPTNLIPALRPVGFYASEGELDPANGGDRCPHAWVPGGSWPGDVEHCGLCGVPRDADGPDCLTEYGHACDPGALDLTTEAEIETLQTPSQERQSP